MVVVLSFLFIILILKDCEGLEFSPLKNIELLPPVGNGNSQYSPFVIHENGWESYVMFYCKNTVVQGVQRDRVWRTENYQNGNTSRWINDQIAVEGDSEKQVDDLSCSPGVVIDIDGKWHMYYVVANRNTPLTLYLFHAISDSPGAKWEKLGQVQVSSIVQPFPGYLETPTPFYLYKTDTIALFFIGTGGCLFVSMSNNAYNFTEPLKIENAPCGSSHGRVTYDEQSETYFFLYSRVKEGQQAPTEIYIISSSEYTKFDAKDEILLFNNTDVGLDRVWSPQAYIDADNHIMKVYYAGNEGNYPWWGSNTQMFVFEFLIK